MKAFVTRYAMAIYFALTFALSWGGVLLVIGEPAGMVVKAHDIVGVLWSAWHLLVVIWGIGDRAGTIPVAIFVVLDGLAGLPAFRVLMVWVYDRTESLFVAMLMHVSITATTLILTPLTTGGHLLVYGLVFASGVWVVIAVVAVMNSRQLSRQALRRRVA